MSTIATDQAARLRIRLYPRRHPYGNLVWAWEIYDPHGRPDHQNITGGAWYDSWTAARNRATLNLHEMYAQIPHAFEQRLDVASVRVCLCGKWPDHSIHAGR